VQSRYTRIGHVPNALQQDREPRRCRSKRRTPRQMYSGAALSLAAMYLRRVRVAGRLPRSGRATAVARLSRSKAASACGKNLLPGPLLGQKHSSGPTCTRTEGRAPVWYSEFTAKAATQQGDSAEFVPSSCVVALGPVVSRACVLVQEVSRAEGLAACRLKATAPITPGSRSMSTAR
jgi:hypothetical protein